jgi:hypothetical protein
MSTSLNITYIDFGPAYGQNGNSGIERKKLAQINELRISVPGRSSTFSTKTAKIGHAERDLMIRGTR